MIPTSEDVQVNLRQALTAARADAGRAASAARQAIRFRQPDGTSAGAADTSVGTPVTLQATASSGLPVSFRSATPLVCTVSGTIVTTVAAGVCTITASQAGNTEFAAAPDRARAFQIGTRPGQQTVTFDQPAGTQPGRPQAKVGAHVPLTASVTRDISPNVRSRAPAPEPGPAISFRSDTPAVCTVSGVAGPPAAGPATTIGEATAVSAGACTITATQPGGPPFRVAGLARTFQVSTGRAPQQITFRQPAGTGAGVMAGIPVTLSASASSRLEVSFRSTTPLACAVSGTTVLTLAPGRCAIIAAQEGSARFAAAREEHLSFMITAGQAVQSIGPASAKSLPAVRTATLPVGVAVRVPVTATSGLAVTLQATTSPGAQFPPACVVSGLTVITLAAGPCTVTAAQGGSQKFGPATASFPLTVVSKDGQPQSIGGFSVPARATVGVPFVVSAQAKSGLAVSFRSGSLPVCTVSGTTATAVGAGVCTTIASQGGSDLYTAAPAVQRSFQVTTGKVAQKITFAQPAGAGTGAAVTLIATASSGLLVSFRADTQDCAVSGATVITVAAGACTVTASQGGNRVYGAARGVARTFPVRAGKQPQHITFGPPPDTRAGAPVTPAAVASSGLPVSFRSGSPAVCTASGTAVIPLTAGTCTVTARQGGDSVYAAAQDVTQSFRILAGQKAQTITFTPPAASPVGVPVTLTASASSGLPVSFWSGTPAVCSVSGATVTTLTPGTCSIAATQGGSTTYAAARPAGWSFPVSQAGPGISRAMIGLLAAAALAAAGGVLALRRRWPRLRLRQRGHPAAAGPSVRAAANPGPAGVSPLPDHRGRRRPHRADRRPPRASTTMIKESPHGSTASPPGDRS